MGIINVLDFHVANLIAAGEVVDRPASVVKELLENAIDSGADSITVEIKRGGVSFIRVTDNGCGMAREDVPVALKRHATSKIREAGDLESIMTLGFRGEALAAISSVSEMRILTKRKEDPVGTVLEASGGRVSAISDAGCPDGTSVIVENLFFNTPARLKFLKKDGTEAANVAAYVEKIALSHPSVRMRFISDGDLKYSTAGDGERYSTIYAVLGRDFAKKLVEIRGGFDGVEVVGYIGTPENVRGNRNMQIFFINDRYVRSKTVTAALEQAFSTFIPSDKFPCAVLYLHMNPSTVDVNVHPAKLEVKFSNERLIFESVYYAVRGALEKRLVSPEMKILEDSQKRREQQNAVFAFAAGKEGRGGERQPTARELLRTLEDTTKDTGRAAVRPTQEAPQAVPADDTPVPLPTAEFSAVHPHVKDMVQAPPPTDAPPSRDALESGSAAEAAESISVPTHIRDAFERPTETVVSAGMQGRPMAQSQAKMPDSGSLRVPLSSVTEAQDHSQQGNTKVSVCNGDRGETAAEYRIVGELFRCYAVLEQGDTVYLVDKHAAHERILFEQMKRFQRQSEFTSQLLLMPIVIPMTGEEAVTARDFSDEIQATGFVFEVGEKEATVTQIPSFLDTAAARDAFCETVTRLCENLGTADLTRQQCYERALFQAACKAAVKAGRVYDEAHLKWICDRVMTDPEIRYCPHGRPVCFTMTKSMIENRFGRT